MLSTLGPRDVVLEKDCAKSNNFELGDTVRARTPVGNKIDLRVRGTVDNKAGLIGDFAVTETTVRKDFGERDDFLEFVTCSREQTQRRSSHGSTGCWKRGSRSPRRRTRRSSRTASRAVDQFLFLIYALLSLSVIVSLFGIVNTLVLSIHERTREIGMMRAIGTPRSLVRRIVRYESVITALIGGDARPRCGLLPGGRHHGGAQGRGIHRSIPVVTLIVFAVLAVLAGVLAAIPPARRASRLNVLEALAYE